MVMPLSVITKVLIMAMTAGRCLAATCANALRIQCMRQRCRVAWKTFEAACFINIRRLAERPGRSREKLRCAAPFGNWRRR